MTATEGGAPGPSDPTAPHAVPATAEVPATRPYPTEHHHHDHVASDVASDVASGATSHVGPDALPPGRALVPRSPSPLPSPPPHPASSPLRHQPEPGHGRPSAAPHDPPPYLPPYQPSSPPPYPAPYPTHPPAAYQPSSPPAVVVVGRKEPALAGVLSWLLPGLGQLYTGRVGPGVGFLVAYLLNLPFVVLLGILVIPVLVSLAIVAWAVIDGVLGAQRRNRELVALLAQQGVPPPPW